MDDDGLVHISLKAAKSLIESVEDLGRKEGAITRSDAVRIVLAKAVNMDEDFQRYKRLFELVTMKTNYVLRCIAQERGQEFMDRIDKGFEMERHDLEQLILEFGVNPNGN